LAAFFALFPGSLAREHLVPGKVMHSPKDHAAKEALGMG
jgi:hypothetical protein